MNISFDIVLNDINRKRMTEIQNLREIVLQVQKDKETRKRDEIEKKAQKYKKNLTRYIENATINDIVYIKRKLLDKAKQGNRSFYA